MRQQGNMGIGLRNQRLYENTICNFKSDISWDMFPGHRTVILSSSFLSILLEIYSNFTPEFFGIKAKKMNAIFFSKGAVCLISLEQSRAKDTA